MTVAVANFIEQLLVHYPVKHDSEEREDAWVNSMIGALKGYGANILQEVSHEIIRTRKYRNFPLLSEILDACDKVEKRREHERRAQTLPAMRPSAGDEWSTERVRLAYELCKGTQIGKEAARDGWVMSLWDFCRKHQRVPQGSAEQAACKRASQEFDEAYALAVRGAAGPLSMTLAKLGSSMLAKREKLAAEVLGKPDISRTA